MTPLIKSVGLFVIWVLLMPVVARSQGSSTPLQLEIERQRVRLSSTEVEERRDAIGRLAAMQHPEASRAALAGLKDPLPIVRAGSVAAILSLPPTESVVHLLPLLQDKDELVRREAVFGLGKSRSAGAIPSLIELLQGDKVDEVRGAAAVALGEISNEAALTPLLAVLTGQSIEPGKKKAKREQNPFVLRSAARALGRIGSRSSVPVLVATLQDEKLDDDIRREAALALGAIGDQAALPTLRSATYAKDPHLAAAANTAIKSILRAGGK